MIRLCDRLSSTEPGRLLPLELLLLGSRVCHGRGQITVRGVLDNWWRFREVEKSAKDCAHCIPRSAQAAPQYRASRACHGFLIDASRPFYQAIPCTAFGPTLNWQGLLPCIIQEH